MRKHLGGLTPQPLGISNTASNSKTRRLRNPQISVYVLRCVNLSSDGQMSGLSLWLSYCRRTAAQFVSICPA